jgi:hypothetical protein
MAGITRPELVRKLREAVAWKTPRVFANGEDFAILFPEEIALVGKTPAGCLFTRLDGTREQVTENFESVKAALADCPRLAPADESTLVNLNHLARSTRGSRDFEVIGRNGARAHVTPGNAAKFCKELNLDALDWVLHYKSIMGACQEGDIRLFREDLRTIGRDRLLAEFSSAGGEIVIARLLYNLIWQVYTRMVNGELSEDEMLMGNIRSFWYTYFKPILATLDQVDERRYGDMIEAFTQFTADWKLFRYKDWDFLDTKRQNKNIGEGKGLYVVFVVEKEGQIRILDFLHKKHKVTTIALGGEASVLSVEYFVDDLEEREIDKEAPLYVFFATDYDPAGHNIQRTFLQKLKRYYFKRVIARSLVTKDLFTPEEIETNKFPLLGEESEGGNWPIRVRKWVEKTGGVGPAGGTWKKRAFGLEADAITPGRMIRLFEEAAKELL